MEITSRIEKQLAQSQQGWVDDLSQVLWVHRTLLRNNQEETPFSLTYGFEAIIPTVESIVAKDGRESTKEVTKRRESKEVALIEKAYYQSKLRSKLSVHMRDDVNLSTLLMEQTSKSFVSLVTTKDLIRLLNLLWGHA
ncbi:reverse transcriptase domain-containing protein [Tanacetum coccineum]